MKNLRSDTWDDDSVERLMSKADKTLGRLGPWTTFWHWKRGAGDMIWNGNRMEYNEDLLGYKWIPSGYVKIAIEHGHL